MICKDNKSLILAKAAMDQVTLSFFGGLRDNDVQVLPSRVLFGQAPESDHNSFPKPYLKGFKIKGS